MYTSMPGCIRVCQDVYEYARMYTSMPECIWNILFLNIIGITGASGLRGWIRLVEALWTPTIRTSISLLGGQIIQKQLKHIKHIPKSVFRDMEFPYKSTLLPSHVFPLVHFYHVCHRSKSTLFLTTSFSDVSIYDLNIHCQVLLYI